MADYFRSAGKCDRSIAAISPVPIYMTAAAPSEEVETPPITATEEETAAAETLCSSSSAPGGGPTAMVDQVSLSRAAYDTSHSRAVRLDIQRENNVLIHLAKREEKEKRRLAEVARLTQELIERVKEERLCLADDEADGDIAAATSEREKKNFDAAEDATPRSVLDGPLPNIRTARQLTALIQSVLSYTDDNATNSTTAAGGSGDEVNKSCAVVLPHRPTDVDIEYFQRIKLEEERVLKNKLVAKRAGGIVALYNDVTLDQLLHPAHVDEEEGCAAPGGVVATPASIVAAHRDKLIPLKVTELVAEGHGQASLEKMRLRRVADNALLRQRLEELRLRDEEEIEMRRRRAAQQDHERQKMLGEIVRQDILRQKLRMEEKAAAEAVLNSTSTVASFHNASSGDVSHLSDVMQSLLLAKRKPPHPIDLYQLTVRHDMGLPDKY